MNKRLAILAICAQGLVGCGGSHPSSTPLSPSAPIPSSPPQPPVIGLAGNYIVTFEADRSCEQLPGALKTRTYEASIGYNSGGNGTPTWFRAYLLGANFVDIQGWGQTFMIKVTDNFVHFDFSDSFIVEKVEPGAYLTINGGEGGILVEPSNLSTISASFDGFFLYCVTNSELKFPGCTANAMTNSTCRSKNSRWTLTRR